MNLVDLGEADGLIAMNPVGHGGFGYDSLFFDPDLKSLIYTGITRATERRIVRSKAVLNLKFSLEKVYGIFEQLVTIISLKFLQN